MDFPKLCQEDTVTPVALERYATACLKEASSSCICGAELSTFESSCSAVISPEYDAALPPVTSPRWRSRQEYFAGKIVLADQSLPIGSSNIDEEGSQSSTGCLDTDTLVAQWVKPLFGAPLATGSGRVLGIRRSQFHRFDIWWTAGMDNRWSSLLHPLPTSGPAHMTLGTRGARLALVMDGCQALGAKGQGSNSAVSC
ncbi:hypothetical protein Bbelb_447120 [Branchiostoma belcheri]|nr:hypothetical protein Bbelb_447120 [Branchiostoma belcheri]